jgi:hypothetical protein
VYFGENGANQGPKVNWAIYPIGPPFRGKRQPVTFDHKLKIADIDCDDDHLKCELKLAMIKKLSDIYHSQERYPEDTPVYGRTAEEVLTLWYQGKLDLEEPGTIDEIKGALATSFGLSISNLDIEFLTKISRLGTPIFESNRWREILCYRSQPSFISLGLKDKPGRKSDDSQNTLEPSPEPNNKLKRKSEDSGNTLESPSPKRLATSPIPDQITPSADVLRFNLIISKWLRLELDITDDSNLEAVRQWLNKIYEVEADCTDVNNITEEAGLSQKSPLRTTAFQRLVAEARTEITSALMNPLRARSRSSSAQFHSFSASFKREYFV